MTMPKDELLERVTARFGLHGNLGITAFVREQIAKELDDCARSLERPEFLGAVLFLNKRAEVIRKKGGKDV